MPLTDDLRGAIKAVQNTEELSLNELGRRCGVSAAQLSRFLHGERSLTLPAAEKVCDFLGLKLVREERGQSAPPQHKPTPRPNTPTRKRRG
jgi:transcriptional regulator with XRE-family HTH domain